MYKKFSYKKVFPIVLFCVALTAAIFANSWMGIAFSFAAAVFLSYDLFSDYIRPRLKRLGTEEYALEALIMYSDDAVLAFDNGGKVIFMNETARKLVSSDRAFCFSQMLAEWNIEAKDISGKYKESLHYTLRGVRFGEKTAEVSFAEFAYIEKNEKKYGVICSLRDVSGCLESEYAIRDLAANVSHELRTPVTGIKGALETVLLYPTLDPEMRNRLLEMAMDECDRMTRLIEDLSHLNRNGTDWRMECFETADFLDRVYDILEAEAEKRGHSFIKNYPQDLPMLTGDQEKLQQVFINLLANAVKYTEAGGRISMEAQKEETGIWICVSDNGIGIPQEDMPHLFERSYRTEEARKAESDGAGLGLAISKEIIDAHEGKIEIESTFGEGTCVRVFLPYKKGENKTEV